MKSKVKKPSQLVTRTVLRTELTEFKKEFKIELTTELTKFFEAHDQRMEKRFASIDKKFESIDREFLFMHEKFESMDNEFKFMHEKFDSIDQKFIKIDADLFIFKKEILTAVDGVKFLLDRNTILDNHESRIQNLEQNVTVLNVAVKKITPQTSDI